MTAQSYIHLMILSVVSLCFRGKVHSGKHWNGYEDKRKSPEVIRDFVFSELRSQIIFSLRLS